MGGRRMKGVGMGLTRTPRPPSCAAAASGHLGSPPPTPWRWSRDRSGSRARSSLRAPLTPELLESPGYMENLSVAWLCSVGVGPAVLLCPSAPRVLASHLLVTPGSIPLNPAPGIPDSDQCFCPALVGDLGGLWAEVRGVGSKKSSFSHPSGWGCRGQTHVLEAGH